MKITLVHNPNAGFQQPSKEKLLEVLNGRGIEVTYLSSKDDTFNESLLSNIGDMVVVAGGDGTIRKIARLLLGRHIPIAVIPIGTANNITKTLDKPIGIANTNEAWLNLATRNFDAGIVTIGKKKEYFIESVGFGAVPEMMYQFNQAKKIEQLKFGSRHEEIKQGLSFMQGIFRDYKASYYNVTIDGKNYAGYYLLVEVMNIKSIGPQLQLAPDADPGDGMLDVVLVQEHEKKVFSDYIASLLDEKKLAAGFTVKRGKRISIINSNSRFHVDDELLPDGKQSSPDNAVSIDIEVDKHALSFFSNSFKLN